MMKPCIIVAGLGRCGTSLTMQMLNAAGVPCAGTWPAFEDERTSPISFDSEWLSRQGDRAVKIIDAHRVEFLHGLPNHVVIWLWRDEREQAKSTLKLLSYLGHSVINNRNSVRAVAASIYKDTKNARAKLGLHGGCPFLSIHFEKLIEDSFETASLISMWLSGFGYHADPVNMITVVRKRQTNCLPGLLESDIIMGRKTNNPPNECVIGNNKGYRK